MKRQHRELAVWREAMDLVVEVYRLSSLLPREEAFGLVTQMRRAAVSIPSNLAEGVGKVIDEGTGPVFERCTGLGQ